MTISILGSQTFSSADPVLTIPVGCTNVVCFSSSRYGVPTPYQIHGSPMSLIVSGLTYYISLFELLNPPIGEVETETDVFVLKTFIYLADAGGHNADLEAHGLSQAYGSMNVAANEILIMGGLGTDVFYLTGQDAYIHEPDNAYKVGAGALVNFQIDALDYGSPISAPAQAQLIAARFPTLSGQETTFFANS